MLRSRQNVSRVNGEVRWSACYFFYLLKPLKDGHIVIPCVWISVGLLKPQIMSD
jgi:hypothetical protein